MHGLLEPLHSTGPRGAYGLTAGQADKRAERMEHRGGAGSGRRKSPLGILVAQASSVERGATMATILLVIFVLLVLGTLPTWPHSRGWGYYPSGGLGLVVLILFILLLTGQL